ncbi:RHS repeat-associated core domain-containing protein [Pseudomonas sp.]|uniref:RHS repeat domain-containing protein n=1 Tax=Pseudomonas sp. TaxID=306 RepID=UPI002E2F7B18|nr:RHS repeat-associated core domain-containing protein [Pseudomonas sp.]HEX4548517.1 RHS repeat-associated core domain-containing protein [Pseudomonas sp.]
MAADSLDWHTPTLTVYDNRTLPVRQVAYWRNESGARAAALITRRRYDPAGRQVEQWDPRLFGTAPRANLASVYDLTGQPLKVDSVDAGWRLHLPGLANERLQHWDQRGNHWQYRYDALLRLVAVTENARPDVERFSYADSHADAGANLRGQLTEQLDPAGLLRLQSYSLLAQRTHESRLFAGETAAFTTLTAHDALGNVVQLTDAGGHRQQSRYDVAGQLQQVWMWLAGASAPEPVIRQSHYNAAGQLTEQLAGNGVRSQWLHDPADGRLSRLLARKDQQPALQDLHYFYDPVGNVLRIEDYTLGTVYFANQRVEGKREFAYDSLYRLLECSGFEGEIPQQTPGLPQPIPIDPGRRYNYTEHYHYDAGNNLIELRHVREGHNFTQHMLIDPHSNRAVRSKSGDPDPVFSEHFDLHGNLLKLQPGVLPLQWNSRDQLARVTLLQHSNGLPDDEEVYLYSQGERVSKTSFRHAANVTHRSEVRYLPGLEIHTRSDGQHLQVIVLPGARCLHWLSGQPADIETDQLRYSLDDHLGSCSLELDRRAGVISLEHYYAFGGTAWWAARSAVEADYKTIRYSGQEMDASGLYYYGARYYAPWLQRWISADPAGDVDGLNLYAFVGNNPVAYVDINGEGRKYSLRDALNDQSAEWNAATARRNQTSATSRIKNDMRKHTNAQLDILKMTENRMRDAHGQLESMGSAADIALDSTRRTLVLILGNLISWGVGLAVGIGSQALGAAAPGVGNVLGVGLGFGAKFAVSTAFDYVAERSGMSASVNLKTSKLTSAKIIKKAEYKQMDYGDYLQAKLVSMNFTNQKSVLKGAKEGTKIGSGLLLKKLVTEVGAEGLGAISSGIGVLLGLPEIIDETLGAIKGKSIEKMEAFEVAVGQLAQDIDENMSKIEDFAAVLDLTRISGVDIHDLREHSNRVTVALNDLSYTIRTHRTGHKYAA